MASLFVSVPPATMSIPDTPSNGLTLVSLFAGCGGSTLGYKLAGYDVRLAVEWDAKAAAIYAHNFPTTPLYQGDITNLDAQQALDRAQLAPGELDVLDGSPPCQGFSTAGKREFGDSKNRLFEQYVRLLQVFQPRAFVMENVGGMVKGKMKLAFVEITLALKAAGYRVSCRLLNAWWYGVPQDRRRLIWVGLRGDVTGEPGHPVPLRNHPLTVADALQTVSNSMDDLAPAQILPSWQMFRVLTQQERQKHYSLVRLHWNRPAPTVTKDAGNTTAGMVHPTELRKLTIPEVKRIGGYPDWFRLTGTYKEQWAAVGNSVPPPMAEAVGRHIAGLVNHAR